MLEKRSEVNISVYISYIYIYIYIYLSHPRTQGLLIVECGLNPA